MIYDRFQQEAINYINQGYSVIVSAPTGAGKTAIAEHIIEESLKRNQAVIYTAPIKALSNQKFRDFQEQFQSNIGILTGDVSINPYAPVLIMTTEIFRNKILNQPETLNNYHWVIFDEIHYIDNPERGTVWEEALMFLPKHMNLLGLSATIPNIEEFVEWLTQIHHKPIKMVVEENRPVPLKFFFQCNNKIYKNLSEIKYKKFIQPNKITTLINHLIEIKGLPCIYFVFGRKQTEDLAWELAKYDFLEQKEKEEAILLFNELCKRFGLIQEKSAQELSPLIKRGIAYHHAGMLPTLDEAKKSLFT
ncbi:MAG: DEAD/DEAH box helicase [Candidatus Omnitrophica bacterium]|nr:DEAD/DEAH box helicase [Candidatus Omnitrophota bacterium]